MSKLKAKFNDRVKSTTETELRTEEVTMMSNRNRSFAMVVHGILGDSRSDLAKLWSVGKIRPAGVCNPVRRALTQGLVMTDVNPSV